MEKITSENIEQLQKWKADLFKWACRKECSSFSVDDSNRKLVNEIFKYMNGVSESLDSKKGLWLYGPVGTGKSTIIQICRTYDHEVNFDRETWRSSGGFNIASASLVSNQFSRKGQDGIDKYGYNDSNPLTWAFDEVGREPCPTKYYGTEMNVMQFIFQTRYEIRHKCLTHVTTNLYPEDITDMYGDYIADRIKEMFNVIEIKGDSRR